MAEIPWVGVPDAQLYWERNLGYLHFIGPDNKRAVIVVTRGPTYNDGTRNIWHIETGDDGIATVSPSVHFIGHWHSPNPVQFRLISEQ